MARRVPHRFSCLALLASLLVSLPVSAQLPWIVRDGEGTNDLFGEALTSLADVDGDGIDEFVVGAGGHSGPGGLSAGRVYVYSGSTGALLDTIDGDVGGDLFGSAVASVGDVDGDGFPELLIGANGVDGAGGFFQGRAYLYRGATGERVRSWDGEGGSDRFGIAVAGPGDTDGDGIPDLLIGADEHDAPGRPGAGRVYLVSGSDGRPLHVWDGEFAEQDFGLSLAGAGDVDGDGLGDVLVGAPLDSLVDDGPGAVYLYSGATGELVRRWDGEVDGDHFGSAIDAIDDLDDDGVNEVAIGAFHADRFTGRIYVYSGATGALLWSRSGAAESSNFGVALSAVADTDGDGRADLVVGAPSFDGPSGMSSGAATLLSGVTGAVLWNWVGDQGREGFLGDPGGSLGDGVVGLSDLDGDGRAELGAGAMFYNGQPGVDTGRLYVYSGVETLVLVPPISPQAGETVSFEVSRLEPGATVGLVAGEGDEALNVSGCPGAATSVGTFLNVGSAVADGAGAARIDVPVPAGATGRTIRFQVVDPLRCRLSDVVAVVFP